MTTPPPFHKPSRDALAFAAALMFTLPLIYMLLRLHGQGVAP